MDSHESRRRKHKGYRGEVRGVRDLKPLFPGLRRVGSVGYPDKGGADLIQGGSSLSPLNIIYTYDSQKRLTMVTLPVADLYQLMDGIYVGPVRVQCKARNGTRIGSLLSDLINSGRGK